MLEKKSYGASVVRSSSHWHLPTARRYATRHSGRYRHHCTASRYYSLVAFSVAAAAATNTTVAGLRNQANWLKDAYSCFPLFRPTMLSEAPSIGSFSFPWSWLEASLCSIWSWVCWAGKFVWSLSQPWGRLCPPHYHPNPLLFRSIYPHEIPHPLYLKASAEIQFKPDLYSQFFSLKFLKNANVERRGKWIPTDSLYPSFTFTSTTPYYPPLVYLDVPIFRL